MGQGPRPHQQVTSGGSGASGCRGVSRRRVSHSLQWENGPVTKRLQAGTGGPVRANPQGGSVLEMLGHVGTPLVHFSPGCGARVQWCLLASDLQCVSMGIGLCKQRLQVWTGGPVRLNQQGGSGLTMLRDLGTPLVLFSWGRGGRVQQCFEMSGFCHRRHSR